ncbi:DUF3331 domain-containing protein [Paraburkholderia tropica]|uniref:DUF3331 domain-containing protein n=1 Tax=Paraburkholderia tropica TaxID=92647 RepID=UPI0038CD70E0
MNQVLSSAPWTHLVALLSQGAAPQRGSEEDRKLRRQQTSTGTRWPRDVRIRILDRISDRCVTVDWCHPCSGHYGAQLWRECLASRSAVCALSGERIRRGDRVYKIARHLRKPTNAYAVLSAVHVDAILVSRSQFNR